MKKEFFVTIMASAMVFGMTACGNKPTETTTEPTTVETTTEVTETPPVETTTEATTETTVAELTTEEKMQCAGIMYEGLSDLYFGNAVFELGRPPMYVEGHDVVITFKCSDSLKLQDSWKYASGVDLGTAILMWNMAGGEGLTVDITEISKKCTLTNVDGVYTLTVPAELITNNYGYQITIDAGDGKGFCVVFSCMA